VFSTLTVIFPIFALIATGYVCRRSGVMSANTTRELNRYVVYLALPALLFQILAKTGWKALDLPAFAAVVGIGCVVIYGATVAVQTLRGRHLADSSVDGLNAAYANTGFIGIPLCALAFGSSSLAPASIAAILTAAALFGFAIMVIETGLQAERGAGKSSAGAIAGKVALSLAKNPMLVASAAGAVVCVCGWKLPGSLDTFIGLLGSSATPCALVCLGLFFGESRECYHLREALPLVAMKLLVQPALVWTLAHYIFRLTPFLEHVAVIMAALPTGTGSFMLAEFYEREADVTAAVILISTVASLATLTVLLLIFGHA